ncbi:THUMP domain-containing protein 2 [Hoplias malabaricus]|uniref:THUMP domain-containing protein 2 n=1 Tax=Hoplias malabaricus TaxID=27720 RepID=UPI0034625131
MGEAEGAVRFYCTAGGGMEAFLLKEVKHKLGATEVEDIPGRVFFRTRSSLHEIMQLKSAERLFLLLRKAPPLSLPKNPAKAVSIIQQSIVGSPDVWSHALCTWSAFQAELKVSEGRGQKRKRDEEEKEEENRRNEIVESGQLGGLCQDHPTFRVSCRCSGAIARYYNSQNLSRIIGAAISRELGWKADLRQPTVEVNVHLNDDHCVFGIPLLRHPLASRSYIKHTGLRSTIAWAMTSLCPLQETSVILDPMCGVGTILLEAAQECPNAVFIGMDSEVDQLQKAAENVDCACLGSRILLVKSSCMAIPLQAGSVDTVLCDVPFGRKFSCSTDMTTALPQILTEMERVLREGGSLILLLSLQLSAQINKIIKSNKLNSHSGAANHDVGSHDSAHTMKTQISETSQHNQTKILKFSSLHLQNKHKVSLGTTDAIIHTYIKAHIQTETHITMLNL